MELKISCDASVKLKKINTVKSIDCVVVDYEVIKDTLSGNIKINGTYIKDDLDKLYDFEELVPFTVVFRDDNFIVEEIVCGNFSYQEIVNQGIECHFDVFITYQKKDEVKTPSPQKEKVKKTKDEKTPEGLEKPEFIKTPEIAEKVKVIEIEDGDNLNAEPVLKNDEQISLHYDEMLQDLLEKRNDNFLEPEEESEKSDEIDLDAREELETILEKLKENLEIKVVKQDKNDKAEIMVKSMKESYKTISVYFLQNENDVDKLCQRENLNINDVYEDYTKNRRIIVK